MLVVRCQLPDNVAKFRAMAIVFPGDEFARQVNAAAGGPLMTLDEFND